MFDIIKCEADAPEYGFERFYRSKDLRITKAKNLKEAANHRNKEVLILLEDFDFDEGSVKLVAEKKKACFLIDLSRLVKTRKISRAILMSKLRTFLKLCNRHGAFYTFASFAEKEIEIRKPSEIVYISMLLGLNKGQAEFALKMLSHYL